jgi:hypothetical protein
VVSDGGGTRWGSEEVGEELSFWGNGEWEVGEDRSGRSRGCNNGDGSFSNGWQEVLYRDVSKWDMLNNFLKLEVDMGILIFRGQGILKLGAYNVSLLGSDVGKNVEEVGRGGNDRGWGQGAIDIEVHSRVIITPWAGVIPGIVGTIKIVLDDLIGGGDVDLIGVVDLRPISNREGRGDDKSG